MHKIWAVVRREFLDKVRTKAFLIGTLPTYETAGVLAPGFLPSPFSFSKDRKKGAILARALSQL